MVANSWLGLHRQVSWLFYYYDCFEPWCICDDSTADCSCSDCIGIQCGPDCIRISCWLNHTQDDHITPTTLMASLIAQAHRLAMQDQLYKGLHAGQLYWFVYPWWVKKHVLHSITECIKGITDCSALLTHRIAGVLFATWLHVYLQHERPCIRIDQQGDCCTVFPRFAFFFYYFSEYSWTDCILDLLCIASITNFSCGDDTTDHSFFVCSADCIADSIRTACPLICFVGIV